MHVHNIEIADHTAEENATFGLWLDTDISNILIRNLHSSGNRRAGLLLEAGQGPVSVSCSSINHNERGVYIASCANVTLDSCTIQGNRLQQIAIKGDFTNGRTILDWETGLECVGRAEQCKVNSCHVAATDRSQALYGLGDDRDDWASFAAFVSTLAADHNTYCHPEHAFVSDAGENIDFRGWQRITGQDKQSQCLEQD